MRKKNKKLRIASMHSSYVYIAAFCLAFGTFNFFVQKLAYTNKGKNDPQIENVKLNQAQNQAQNQEQEYLNKFKKENEKVALPLKEKKQRFISDLLPILHNANQKIFEDRNTLFKIEKKIQSNNLNVLESAILKKLFNEYKVKNNNLTELKKRIDIVPISLAIAQAAIESGWGTSRFAQEGNAYFGQKVIGLESNGIKPNGSDNPRIKVRKFENLEGSVKAYLNNLNTHYAYKNFRRTRNELRSLGKTLEGELLVTKLSSYSELGNEYVSNVQKIIKKNNLNKYDFIEYTSAMR